ncbi:hypothetical protein [Henriciella marina]|uniref:hypothetical protein n=1 Tax=Henriciella marina TaxID=453851 RepID=UPI000381814E|nr:hypothetical protein [Henriciella marina]
MISLLLDLANIIGGFLLAIGLLVKIPNAGDDIAKGAAKIAPLAWLIGVVALVTAGYFLIVHLTSGPRVFHYEVVGLITGILLLMERVNAGRDTSDPVGSGASGFRTFVAVFGVIAIIVGIQGLFTPNG